MTKFGLLLFLATALVGSSMANAQFSGPFAPANWTLENFGGSDGSVDWSGAPDQLIVVGGNSGLWTFGSTDIYITIRHAGVIQYRWDYSSDDEPNYDSAFELSGAAGGRTLLSSTNGESGVQVIEVVPGDTFGFAIESLDNLGSPGVLTITDFAFYPENDNIGDAISLSLPFETTGTNVGATVIANEQDLEITGSTVWWQFEATATGRVTINTFGSDFDTVLHVYSGDLIAQNNNFNGPQSQVKFDVTAGQLYHVRVGGYAFNGGPAAEGNIVLTGFIPQTNDNFEDSIDVAFPFDITGANAGATVQTSEQNLNETGSTVWWVFQAPFTDRVTISTSGSDFDTVLHVYTDFENGFGNFTLVAENDQTNGTNQSQVTFDVIPGQFYAVRVGGYIGDSGLAAEGNIVLKGFIPLQTNDDFEDSIDMAFPFDTTSTNVGASSQSSEQHLSITRSTVWWVFQAPFTDSVTINTFGSDFDTVLHVYTDLGNGFGNFTLVAENDQANGTDQSQVTFDVIPGQFYAVRVGGYNGGSELAAEGNIVLKGVAFVLGDANGDGFFDFGDIEPFVLAITDPDSFAEMFPNVDPNINLDFDGDGSLSFGDIEGFVDGLLG